jgi:hypothetical protein
MKGISCETGMPFLMFHSIRSHFCRSIFLIVIRDFIDPATTTGNKRHGKILLPVQKTSERTGQEKETRAKKTT